VYLCYLDESGTKDLTGQTTHFVLLALSIPAANWRTHDNEIADLKATYDLTNAELHAGWLPRRYLEQESVAGFDGLTWTERRIRVDARRRVLLAKAGAKGPKHRQKLAKEFAKTQAYVHLTLAERRQVLRDFADLVGGWEDAALFCEAINKSVFGGIAPRVPPLEEAFERVVTRIQDYLGHLPTPDLGLLVCDNNQAASIQLTDLMRRFYRQGNMWGRQFRNIVETPLFVDSSLTGMIQMADLLSFAFRRFHENGERDLLDRVYPRRALRVPGRQMVSVRHYTGDAVACACIICQDRARPVGT